MNNNELEGVKKLLFRIGNEVPHEAKTYTYKIKAFL